jgi:phage baseplate assembly protein W
MGDQAFLGRGWSFPPSFGKGGGEVAMVAGDEDIVQSLQILLGTRQMERIMHEDFGCDLQAFLFEEIDQSLVNNLSSLITRAILFYEPRIVLNRLDISQSEDSAGLLLLSISYTVRSTNSRFNMVYPFYLNEAANHGTN